LGVLSDLQSAPSTIEGDASHAPDTQDGCSLFTHLVRDFFKFEIDGAFRTRLKLLINPIAVNTSKDPNGTNQEDGKNNGLNNRRSQRLGLEDSGVSRRWHH
jgi:hypothetical protein